MATEPKPKFFATAAAFRAWLARHHAKASELVVGFYKRETGKPSLTWPESVDQALCFGWIDGIRRKLNEEAYTIRFTPRRPGSNWSTINLRKIAELEKQGLLAPAGQEAFARRRQQRSRNYSYEDRRSARLSSAQETVFKRHRKAWAFFKTQAPSYQRLAIFWVTSAKREETQQTRLTRLISVSTAGKRL